MVGWGTEMVSAMLPQCPKITFREEPNLKQLTINTAVNEKPKLVKFYEYLQS